MSTPLHSPLSIMQHLYFEDRLKWKPIGHFLEIGSGGGENLNTLMRYGWTGHVYETSDSAFSYLRQRFADFDDRVCFFNSEFISNEKEEFDLILISNVLEHLPEKRVSSLLRACRKALKKDGSIVIVVPTRRKYWSYEDELVGHLRRYELKELKGLIHTSELKISHLAWLGFPVANITQPLINMLLRYTTKSKINDSALIKTGESGIRKGNEIFKFLVNRHSLYLCYQAQKLFLKVTKSHSIYIECHGDDS